MKFRYITLGIGIVSMSTFIGLAVSFFLNSEIILGHSVVTLIAAGGGIMIGYGLAKRPKQKRGDFE